MRAAPAAVTKDGAVHAAGIRQSTFGGVAFGFDKGGKGEVHCGLLLSTGNKIGQCRTNAAFCVFRGTLAVEQFAQISWGAAHFGGKVTNFQAVDMQLPDNFASPFF
nr:MAG TPA: hypothetical protein [Ackermannviridae sp.]